MGIVHKIVSVALAAASVANCATASPRMVSYSFSGSGCPSNGANLTIDANKLIVEMPNFTTEIGPSTNCQGHFNMADGLAGYRLAVKTITNEGYLYSSGGVDLVSYTTLYWSQDASHTYTAQSDHSIKTEAASSRQFLEKIAVPVEYASQCGQVGILNVNWRISMKSVSSKSAATFIGAEDSPPKQVIELEWVPC